MSMTSQLTSQPMIPCSLSQLIRVGAQLKPQGYGWPIRDGKTCVAGAAFDALGILDDPCRWRELALLYPYLNDVVAVADICPHIRPSPLRLVITHLNDCHHWTREAIADWVEGVEESIGYVTVGEVDEVDEVPATARAVATV
jgi:hypothetical protein